VNTFSGATLDRAAHRRTDAGWLAAALADPASRALVTTPEGVPITGDRRDPRPATTPLADALADSGRAPAEAILLGVGGDDAALFLIDAVPRAGTRGADGAQAGARITNLRDVAARLSPGDAGLLAYAQALAAWQRTHRFCGICGTATVPEEAGHTRRCPRDGSTHHPRTDPVVIAIVTNGDRVMLGRQPGWPRGRYSALAGFVEPGESLEDAVAREIAEEAGVQIGSITYHSSQPWPFPGSLMIGFLAEHAGGEPRPLDAELEDVRWFDRAQVTAATAEDGWTDGDGGPGLLLPPSIAVARRLIETWLS
jgi:NAD+ diphosphatase